MRWRFVFSLVVNVFCLWRIRTIFCTSCLRFHRDSNIFVFLDGLCSTLLSCLPNILHCAPPVRRATSTRYSRVAIGYDYQKTISICNSAASMTLIFYYVFQYFRITRCRSSGNKQLKFAMGTKCQCHLSCRDFKRNVFGFHAQHRRYRTARFSVGLFKDRHQFGRFAEKDGLYFHCRTSLCSTVIMYFVGPNFLLYQNFYLTASS